MNPVVLIATHQRLEITRKNIESLLRQSVVPKVVLCCTDPKEAKFFKDTFPSIQVLSGVSNNPLGRKWQSGVDQCLNADPLIITGSDDILGPGFIKKACQLVEEGNHFVGLQRFWQHHRGTAYFCEYLAHQPIGGGRIYSGAMLKAIKHKLFDPTKERHLDDFGWNKVRTSGLKCKWVRNTEAEGLHIHAIKGDWICKNPFNPNHKNIKVLRTEPSYNVLPDLFPHPALKANDDLAIYPPN